jgi:membrane-bound metal-dependent hydrolase YbcI (DUF457 family)
LPLLALALAAAACAPDLDFIPGVLVGDPNWLHRGLSHSLAASLLFGAVAYVATRAARARGAGLFGVLMGAAYASHLILDMFSPDPLRFNGVPLFWPLSDQHFILPAQVFLDIRRDPAADGFLASLWDMHNLHAILREILVMGAVVLVGRMVGRTLTSRPAGAPRPAPRRLDRRVDSES